MSGGKSSTSTTTQQDIRNETNQAEASGIVAGDVLQGEITYYNEFSPNVLEAFQSLIGLSEQSISTAREAGGAALQVVSQRQAEADTPALASINALMPVFIIGAIGAAIYIVRKK